MSLSGDKLLRNLDWNLLYTFLVIVEESSITGAARKLSLSQPSVSNALKRLEAHLGMRLIERRKGLFALTFQGQRVYEYISSAGDIISHMAELFSDEEGSLHGEIDIQIASHTYCPAFDQTLAEFHSLYPLVLINISSQPSADIVTAVAGGKLKIGICTKKIAQTGLQFDLLGYEQLAFFCGPPHPLYGRKNLTLDDLKGLAYVSFESDQPGEGLDDIARLRAEHSFWGQLAAVSANEEEIRRLILTGVGFGALGLETARPYVEQGQLFQLPPYDQLPISKVYLVTPENNLMSEIEKRFLTMLRNTVKQSVRDLYFNGNDLPEAGQSD